MGHMDLVRLLVEKYGAKLDAHDVVGDTALIDAVCRERSDIALFLIQSGADVNRANNSGYESALMNVLFSSLCPYVPSLFLFLLFFSLVNVPFFRFHPSFLHCSFLSALTLPSFIVPFPSPFSSLC